GVEIQDGDEWEPVIRLMDFGPTAWRTVGLPLPAVHSRDDSVRVRLTFPVDGFHIDEIQVMQRVRRVEQKSIPLARVMDTRRALRADMVRMLSSADSRYVETNPGDSFTIFFDVTKPD